MIVREILNGVDLVEISGPSEADIQTIAYSSRDVAPGSLFFALRGVKADGNEFVPDALEKGAIAIASERARPSELSRPATWVQVRHGRRALATASANFFGRPADSLKLIGVTGTNGKTTTTYLLDSILAAAGYTSGLIGTIGYRTPRGRRDALNTTPESFDLQSLLAEIREGGGTHAVLEASSHALAMDRLWDCGFAVAVLTNLTRDHLDFHKNFEDYFAAKRRLFEGTGGGPAGTGVINLDDPWGQQLRGVARQTLTFGLSEGAKVTTRKFQLSFAGLDFTAHTPAGKIELHSVLVGRTNVYNILAATAAAVALGVPREAIEGGIAQLQSVPGRFQRIDAGQPFLVVVDYAHTDDALRSLITTARELNPSGRIITLFGAGGDRDRMKRPLMGEVAGRLSDLVVLTSDNPRSEDPLRIINDVAVGLQKVNAKYRVEPDRARAVEIAIDEARAGDMVLLAGKGHETCQVVEDRRIDYDDREVAQEVLRRRGYQQPAA